jgi:hypothetical protein
VLKPFQAGVAFCAHKYQGFFAQALQFNLAGEKKFVYLVIMLVFEARQYIRDQYWQGVGLHLGQKIYQLDTGFGPREK